MPSDMGQLKKLQYGPTTEDYVAIKKEIIAPGWNGSVNWELACEWKDRQFDSQSGHVPGLRVRSPVGGVREATTH